MPPRGVSFAWLLETLLTPATGHRRRRGVRNRVFSTGESPPSIERSTAAMAAPPALLHKSGRAPTNRGRGQREFLHPSGADGRFGKERLRPSAGFTTFRDLGCRPRRQRGKGGPAWEPTWPPRLISCRVFASVFEAHLTWPPTLFDRRSGSTMAHPPAGCHIGKANPHRWATDGTRGRTAESSRYHTVTIPGLACGAGCKRLLQSPPVARPPPFASRPPAEAGITTWLSSGSHVSGGRVHVPRPCVQLGRLRGRNL